MSRSTKKNIVQGVFNSVLCYSIPLFGGCNKAELNLLQIQENRAAHCVLNFPPRTSRCLLFDKLGWLTVEQLIAYHTLITVNRIRMKKEPEYLADNLPRDNIYGRIIVKGTLSPNKKISYMKDITFQNNIHKLKISFRPPSALK